MKKILLIEPYDFLESTYSTNTNFCIYKNKTFSYFEQNKKKNINICYSNDVKDSKIYETVRAKILFNLPIWYRWMGQADVYEDFLYTSVLFVFDLKKAMEEVEVKSAIFFTGIAHHIEYSLIEIAAQMANCKQIFLYPCHFAKGQGRLLPLLQSLSIKDRKPLNIPISRDDSENDIIDYYNNALSMKPPVNNESINFVSTSYLYALFRVFLIPFRSIYKKINKLSNDETFHPIDIPNDYDAFSMFRIINRQRISLKYYLQKQVNDKDIQTIIRTEKKIPIIFAHYQPEASTFPEGGEFGNHLDVVIGIRKLGYKGKIIYKEHPGSSIYTSIFTGFSKVGICRSIEYYDKLSALGCIFASTNFKLNKHNSKHFFPVTITGSISIERSLTGQATCCAGMPWWKDAPGIYNLEQCFCKNGVFYSPKKWYFDRLLSFNWFKNALLNKTIINYPGIATGVSSKSNSDLLKFLKDFDKLTKVLIKMT